MNFETDQDPKKGKKNGKKFDTSKLFSHLPKGLDHLDVLQVGMSLVQEAQKQAAGFKKDAMLEALKVFGKLNASYHEVSSKFSDVSEMAKKQAHERMTNLHHKWNERKHLLPEKMTKEVDQLLVKIGWPGQAKATKKKPAPKKPAAKAKATAKPKPAAKKPSSKKVPVVKVKAATKAAPKTKAPAKKNPVKKTSAANDTGMAGDIV